MLTVPWTNLSSGQMGTAGHARLGGGPTGSHPGRRDGVVVPASTGSLVCRAERGVGWEPPAPPPTPEGVSAHGPVHGPSVSAWVSHDSGDPSFQRCRSQRRPSRGDTACDPTTHPAAALGRRLGPGTARGSLSTWPPPAWRGMLEVHREVRGEQASEEGRGRHGVELTDGEPQSTSTPSGPAEGPLLRCNSLPSPWFMGV